MCPSHSLLLLATLVLLNHLDSASTTPVPLCAQCSSYSKNLLRTTDDVLGKTREALKHYSCSAEDIDHEDITRDKTVTLKACLPRELATNESCLAPGDTSHKTLCHRGIYEDLRMYKTEFKAINADLLNHNQKQFMLDEKLLVAIDELMQALNTNSETLPQDPSLEQADPYKVKIKLCILLHAFRIRAVTIDKAMSFLHSS